MDVLALLEAKGIDYVHKGGDEYAIVCPFQANHSDGQDSKPSFGINVEKLKAHCFSCGASMNEVSLTKWLLGDEIDDEQMAVLSVRARLKKIQGQEDDLFVEAAEMETYMPPGKPFDREYRGISVETYRTLGAIECQRGRYENRICFPIFQHERLLGVDARALGSEVPKYLRPKGCDAKKWLYPFDLAKRQKVGQVILVEGIYHSINFFHRTGKAEALCYFGSNNWSEHKTLLVLELNPEQVIFWPDNDKAGIKALETICPGLGQWVDLWYIPPEVLPDDGRDLGDFSLEEIEHFLSLKRRWK